MNTNKKVAIGVAIVAVAGLAGSALTATISVPTTALSGGQGVGVIAPAGYNVTNLKFTTTSIATDNSTTTAQYLTGVSFSIFRGTTTTSGTSADTDTVLVQLRSASGATNWSACGAGSSGARTCNSIATNANVTVTSINNVAIVAYGA